MTGTDQDVESAQIVPAYIPTAAQPQVLIDATRHLKVATGEFYLAMQRLEIWRVLAYDQDLAKRISNGYATAGYYAVRSAMFEALLITLTRMFDESSRGEKLLSLEKICQKLCEPEAKAYIVGLLAADARDFPARLALVTPLGEADKRSLQADANADALRVTERTNKEFEALICLRRKLTKSPVKEALKRLRHLRHTAIAHRDLEPEIATLSRPLYRDLDTLFGAAGELIGRMNSVGQIGNINYDEFSRVARLRARAFAVGLRAESPDELRAFDCDIRQGRGEI